MTAILNLNVFSSSSSQQSAFLDPAADAMETEEEQAHSPPPSLVPRLHVILSNRLEHNNPLLPTDIQAEETKAGDDNLLSGKAASACFKVSVGMFCY